MKQHEAEERRPLEARQATGRRVVPLQAGKYSVHERQKRLFVLNAPWCLKNHYDIPTEGYFFVENGTIVVDTWTWTMKVYEKEEWEEQFTQAESRLVVDLKDETSEIDHARVRSSSGHVKGGLVQIFANSEYGRQKITLKMPMEDYNKIKALLLSA